MDEQTYSFNATSLTQCVDIRVIKQFEESLDQIL